MLALLIVYVAVQVFWLGVESGWPIGASGLFEGLFKLAIWFLPCLILTMILERASLHEAWRKLGLHGPPARGWRFGLIATLPMAIAAVVLGSRLPDVDDVIGNVLFGPLAEEVLFRGFLFTALIQQAKWRWPAALVASSVAFGLAHLPNLNLGAILTSGPIFAVGGALFGWVFYRSGSLWPAIGLHGFMNLWWELLRGDRPSAVVAPDLPGVAQGLSMLLAVVLTLYASRGRIPSAREEEPEARAIGEAPSNY
jgi:CAAX protease family protein